MGRPEALVELLAVRRENSVLCVGHAPNLDLVASHLVGCHSPPLRLKKAGLVTLEVHPPELGGTTIYAIYPPSALRLLGGAP